MMKLLYVSSAGERGGLEVVLLNVLRCLDRSRFTPHVLLLEDGPFVREVRETRTKIHIIEAGRVREIRKGWRALAEAVRLIRLERIDLIHTWNAKAHVYGGLAAAIARVPALYHLHGVPRLTLSRDGLVSLLSVVVPARQTVACSAYVAQSFKKAWRSRREIVVVHNGTMLVVHNGTMLPAQPSLVHSEVRQEFGVPDHVPMILMPTRLQRGKGVHVFLDAAAQVVRSQPEARFLVLGGALFGLEPDYEVDLQRQVERLDLRRAVQLVGFRPDVFRFYQAADIVVQSSIEPEAFGMVLIEAMAWGRPVVASDVGGPTEIVLDGVTGLLVPPNDPDRLARALVALLKDPGGRVRMGRAGAARVRDYFKAERMVSHLQVLYDDMIRRPGDARRVNDHTKQL
jgi:glycosyltransferase involved in cell wall biosynthesis